MALIFVRQLRCLIPFLQLTVLACLADADSASETVASSRNVSPVSVVAEAEPSPALSSAPLVAALLVDRANLFERAVDGDEEALEAVGQLLDSEDREVANSMLWRMPDELTGEIVKRLPDYRSRSCYTQSLILERLGTTHAETVADYFRQEGFIDELMAQDCDSRYFLLINLRRIECHALQDEEACGFLEERQRRLCDEAGPRGVGLGLDEPATEDLVHKRVRVRWLCADSRAERHGVQRDDVLVSLNDVPMRRHSDVHRFLGEARPRLHIEGLRMLIDRQGETVEIWIPPEEWASP